MIKIKDIKNIPIQSLYIESITDNYIFYGFSKPFLKNLKKDLSKENFKKRLKYLITMELGNDELKRDFFFAWEDALKPTDIKYLESKKIEFYRHEYTGGSDWIGISTKNLNKRKRNTVINSHRAHERIQSHITFNFPDSRSIFNKKQKKKFIYPDNNIRKLLKRADESSYKMIYAWAEAKAMLDQFKKTIPKKPKGRIKNDQSKSNG